MMQFILPFLAGFTVLDDFLCGCLPGGTFEAMTTPSDLANRFAKVGVMTMDFIVGCVSRDMAVGFLDFDG